MLVFSTTNLAKTMPSSAADNAIMTIGEVADYLKVTERTIYRLAGAKKIPSFKVGGVAGGFRRRTSTSGSAGNQIRLMKMRLKAGRNDFE
jgi:excisionase family DNA binding protein